MGVSLHFKNFRITLNEILKQNNLKVTCEMYVQKKMTVIIGWEEL